MKLIANLLTIALIISLASCGGKDVDIPDDAREKLIWSSSPERPGWTMNEPEADGDAMQFVGISGRYATEKAAREDARRNVTSAVVKYMGTLVKDKFEQAKVSFGLESNIIDATASAREFEKQFAVNVAKRLKMNTWYGEKWGTETGIGYQYFVLAAIPMQSVDESYKKTATGLAKEAEKRAKESNDAHAKDQAEKAADFWKQMQAQGVAE